MDNPFGVKNPAAKSDYLREIELARSTRNATFIADVATRTGFAAPADFIDALGIRTKAGLNKGVSAPSFDQGDVLYGTLRRRLDSETRPVTVLEIGTSHGFSATVMAKALKDWGGGGKVLTIDPLPAGHAIWWNTVADLDGPSTIRDALKGFEDLIDDYVVFLQGFSDTVLETLYAPRVHFAFIDGSHRESVAEGDLRRVARLQRPGDVLVADDYTRVCPGVIRAVDRLVAESFYRKRELFAIDGENGVTIGMQVLERV